MQAYNDISVNNSIDIENGSAKPFFASRGGAKERDQALTKLPF